jgi:probable rRNA maturation factor
MAQSYRIAVHVDARYARQVKKRPLAALGRLILRQEGTPAGAEVSVVVTNDEEVRELNRTFLGEDAATDVLSFGMDGPDGFVTAVGKGGQLGEIVISLPRAQEQARQAGQALKDELEHLLAHGILHLLGYDHQTVADSRRMRGREEAILGRVIH